MLSSLRTKILLLFITVFFALGLVLAFESYEFYISQMVTQHKLFAQGMPKMASTALKGERLDALFAPSSLTFQKVYHDLLKIREQAFNVRTFRLVTLEEEGYQVILDVIRDTGKALSFGSLLPYPLALQEYSKEIRNGRQPEPVFQKEEHWSLSLFTPLRDHAGLIHAYIFTEISLDWLKEDGDFYLKNIARFYAFTLVLILLLLVHVLNQSLIKPLKAMAEASASFDFSDSQAIAASLEHFSTLKVESRDELETLYHSFLSQAQNSFSYITDLKAQKDAVAKLKDTLILTLADMVESRDLNTGFHLKKTAAYVEIILRTLKKDPAFRDLLTPSYIRDVVASAPLHDIGKITIPDAILNKPGRLTPEEFAIMQGHTTSGGQIIEKIIQSMPKSNYLHEAKNLALYHHERFDGTGYPEGLRGRDIPLSARVMAVADVFDALISRRSYKEPFGYAEAFRIIAEEGGSHFDPVVVGAFLSASTEILATAQKFKS